MLIRDLDEERRGLLLGKGFAQDKKLINLNGYPAVHLRAKGLRYVHRLVAEKYLGARLARDVFVHHKDEDRWNFRVSNLHVCSHGEHNGLHRRFGADNHFFGKEHSRKTRAALSALAKRRGPPALGPSERAKIAAFATARERDGKGRFESC